MRDLNIYYTESLCGLLSFSFLHASFSIQLTFSRRKMGLDAGEDVAIYVMNFAKRKMSLHARKLGR